MNHLKKILDFILYKDAQLITEEDRKKRYLHIFSIVAGVLAIVSLLSVAYQWKEYFFNFTMGLVLGIVYLTIPFLLQKGYSTKFCGNLFIVGGILTLVSASIATDGVESPNLVMLALVPIMALLVISRRSAYIYLAISILITLVIGVIQSTGVKMDQQFLVITEPQRIFYYTMMLMLITILSFSVVNIFYSNLQKAMDLISNKNDVLEETKQSLIKTNQYKDNFIANVSHELRTPMHAILSLSELLRARDNDEVRQHEFALEINRSAKNLLVIINDLLDITKISKGQLTIDIEPFYLVEVIDLVKDIHSRKSDENNVRLILNDYNPALNQLELSGDKVRLTQILSNLIHNAFKFTEKGSIILDIGIEEKTAELISLTFTVSDTGRGIEQIDKERIFESFYKGVMSADNPGLGMGLTIVKNLVEAMGGLITMESELGKGTKFTINISFNYRVNDLEEIAESPDKISGDSLSVMNILVVDDNEVNLLIIKEMAAGISTNLNMTCMNNPVDVVEQYDPGDFDVIMMDIHMPEISGIDLAQIIRKVDQDVRIIAVTASTMKHEIDRYKTFGFNDHLGKPFTEQELRDCLVRNSLSLIGN